MTKTVLLVLLVIVVVGVVAYFSWYSHTNAPTLPFTPPAPVASSTAPVSSYIQPTSGPIGATVTIYGSFSALGNTILMNGLVGPGFKDVPSPDGHTLTFTVPGTLGPNCAPDQACPQFLMEVTNNSYKVSVITNGVTQDIGTFTVVGGRSPAP